MRGNRVLHMHVPTSLVAIAREMVVKKRKASSDQRGDLTKTTMPLGRGRRSYASIPPRPLAITFWLNLARAPLQVFHFTSLVFFCANRTKKMEREFFGSRSPLTVVGVERSICIVCCLYLSSYAVRAHTLYAAADRLPNGSTSCMYVSSSYTVYACAVHASRGILCIGDTYEHLVVANGKVNADQSNRSTQFSARPIAKVDADLALAPMSQTL